MKKHEIYCFNNGGPYGYMIAVALADDGVCIASHLCTNEHYMPHDLGMMGSTWKHDLYDAHFGKGNWELVWIDDPRTDERVQKAIELHRKMANGGAK